MRSLKRAYDGICDFESLYLSHKRARRGKREKTEVVLFEMELNAHLDALRRRLLDESYIPGAYRVFEIREPKVRRVESLPYRDRVVQHALCDHALGPHIDRMLIHDAAACRVGKGTHFALDRLGKFFRQHWNAHGNRGWILKTDIARYFESVDHEVLKEMLYPTIRDARLRGLLETILDDDTRGVREAVPGKGLPLGNMTSQWFANLYLSPLDRFIKEELKLRHYVRYMDDGVALHPDREYLSHCLREIRKFADERLKLQLNRKSQMMPVGNGVDFLGFHTYLTETGKVVRKVRHESSKRMKRKLKTFQQRYREGEMGLDEIECSLYSWLGHAEYGDTYGLRREMLESFVLSRGTEQKSKEVV